MEAELEQQKKEKIIALLDADVLTSKADADWLKESLQEQLTPEISEYIDGKPTLEGIIKEREKNWRNTMAEMEKKVNNFLLPTLERIMEESAKNQSNTMAEMAEKANDTIKEMEKTVNELIYCPQSVDLLNL